MTDFSNECSRCCLPPWTWKARFTERVTTRSIQVVWNYVNGVVVPSIGEGTPQNSVANHDYGPEIFPDGPRKMTGLWVGRPDEGSNVPFVWTFSEELSDGTTGKRLGTGALSEDRSFAFGADVKAAGYLNEQVGFFGALRVVVGGENKGAFVTASRYTDSTLVTLSGVDYIDLEVVNDISYSGDGGFLYAVGRGKGGGDSVFIYRDTGVVASVNPTAGLGEAYKCVALNTPNFTTLLVVGFQGTGSNETHNVFIYEWDSVTLTLRHSFHALFGRGDPDLDTNVWGLDGFGSQILDPPVRFFVGGDSRGGRSAELYRYDFTLQKAVQEGAVDTGGKVTGGSLGHAKEFNSDPFEAFYILAGYRATNPGDGQPYSVWVYNHLGTLLTQYDHKGNLEAAKTAGDTYDGRYNSFLIVTGDRVDP